MTIVVHWCSSFWWFWQGVWEGVVGSASATHPPCDQSNDSTGLFRVVVPSPLTSKVKRECGFSESCCTPWIIISQLSSNYYKYYQESIIHYKLLIKDRILTTITNSSRKHYPVVVESWQRKTKYINTFPSKLAPNAAKIASESFDPFFFCEFHYVRTQFITITIHINNLNLFWGLSETVSLTGQLQ